MTTNEATQRYGELETLILYFEHEMLIVSFAAQPHLIGQVRHITDDIKRLDEVNTKFRKILAEAENMVRAGDLFKLFSKKNDLDNFKGMLSDLQYLAQLSTDDLLDNYCPAILNDNISPFTNFTQDQRDTYMKLKFRAINKRNAQQNNHDQP